ncbi:MAG: bifunctional acetaldehyde-CoA/alcohol dehydrogenase [Rickettsiales bacterium]|jgi:acetaldehyde dehydrogenase/alcohol dehydrogenase|nr:bifunctional acetaldehyde-CoA/alcohol dehydrogenase [Rickettsiales bacterium]
MAKKEDVIVVNSVDSLNERMKQLKEAQRLYSTYTQEQVDLIFRRTALLANVHRIPLAKMAVEETGMGVVEDKIIKNHFAAEYIYNKYKNEKTCGIIEEDWTHGMLKIAAPIGIIACITPTTNPTSTAIFKCLIALKTRNAMFFAPHPRAKNCTIEALKVVAEAAKKAGAPDNLIAWIDDPTIELSGALMSHPDVDTILATGGPNMVKAAYSCGKPAVGVGAGNSPAVIDETADIQMAVSSIIQSKTFDNGMICASEQSVVVVESIYKEVKEEFIKRGCYFLKDEEKPLLAKFMFNEKGALNANMVGHSASNIAENSGFKVSEKTKVLIAETDRVDDHGPFTHEKLSPILGFFKAKNFEDAVDKAFILVNDGGAGHTSILYTNQQSKDRIEFFGNKMNTGRVLINTPSSFGGIGDLYNFRLEPSLTLGCGSWGKNSISGNVGIKNLINIKSVAMREENMLWFKVPPKIYFKKGCTKFALAEALQDKKKALIVTEQIYIDLGKIEPIIKTIQESNCQFNIFSGVQPDPKISMVKSAMTQVNSFKPDVIIAFGGGSAIDTAKMLWFFYEQPNADFKDVAMRFMDIRKRIFTLPDLGKLASLVAIPTTSGTGSEVTPFTVITDDETSIKYPLADYIFTPTMAIVDPEHVGTMPKLVASASGIDAITHSLEAYISVMASPFTDGIAIESLQLLFKYLPEAINQKTEFAMEQVHYAATMAGIAFSNAFLGICHSLAHKMGGHLHIPHGFANAYLISQVIRFNSSETPTKQAAFSQYKYPFAKQKYARLSDILGFGGKNDDEKIDNLIKSIENLKKEIGIANSIKTAVRFDKATNKEVPVVTQKQFDDFIESGVAEEAYDDQCTGANPRYPLIKELEQIYRFAWEGDTKTEI